MGLEPPTVGCSLPCRSVQPATFARIAGLARRNGHTSEVLATRQAHSRGRGLCFVKPLACPSGPGSQRRGSSASQAASAPCRSNQSRQHSQQQDSAPPRNEHPRAQRDVTRLANDGGPAAELRRLAVMLLGPSSLAAVWAPGAGAADEQAISMDRVLQEVQDLSSEKVLDEMQRLLTPTPYSPDPTPLIIFAAILVATFWLTNYVTPGIIFRSPGEGGNDAGSPEPQAPPRSPLPAYQRAAGFKSRSAEKASSPEDSAAASGDRDDENKG